MNTRYIAEEYRLSHWSQIMRERSESGLSIKAFCEQAGFHTNVYYYWQRKLREAACAQMTAAVQDSRETSIAPNGWALCESSKAEISDAAITIEVGKFRITVAENTDMEHLSKVCRMLVSLC